jgi:hypothetical protein
MAKSKLTTLPRSLRDHLGIAHIDVSDVREYDKKEPFTQFLDVGLNATVHVTWEYDTEHGGEFLEATFTSEQLFKLAVGTGLLTTTTSGREKLPRGVNAIKRHILAA